MRRSTLAGVAVAVVAGVAAVVGLRAHGEGPRAGRGAPPPETSAADPEAGFPPGGPVLAARAAGEQEPGEAPAPAAEPGTVHGVVVDADGAPLPEALVALFEERPAEREGLAELVEHRRASTDAHGRFRFSSLRPAVLWLRADAEPEGGCAGARATVGGPGLQVEVVRRRTVTVRVLDPDGRPAWRVSVRAAWGEEDAAPTEQPPGSDWTACLRRERYALVHDSTDRVGEARLRVGPGPYRVAVFPLVETSTLAPPPVTTHGDAVTVRLEQGNTVCGVLRDATGEPVARAFVWWRAAGDPWNSKRAEASGSYSIAALPKGTVELWADVFGREPPPGASTLVAATDRQDADLRVDLGDDLVVRIENWPPGAAGTAVLRDRTEAFGRLSVADSAVSPSGEATFRRLQRDHAYALRVETEDGTLAWIRDDVPREGAPLRLRLAPTESLRVVLDADAPFQVTGVSVADFDVSWSEEAESSPKGVGVVLKGLPRGTHVLDFIGRTENGDRLSGTVEAEVPGDARLRLEGARATARR